MYKIMNKSGKEMVFKDIKAVGEKLEKAFINEEINENSQAVFVGAFTFKIDKITKQKIYLHSVSM